MRTSLSKQHTPYSAYYSRGNSSTVPSRSPQMGRRKLISEPPGRDRALSTTRTLCYTLSTTSSLKHPLYPLYTRSSFAAPTALLLGPPHRCRHGFESFAELFALRSTRLPPHLGDPLLSTTHLFFLLTGRWSHRSPEPGTSSSSIRARSGAGTRRRCMSSVHTGRPLHRNGGAHCRSQRCR